MFGATAASKNGSPVISPSFSQRRDKLNTFFFVRCRNALRPRRSEYEKKVDILLNFLRLRSKRHNQLEKYRYYLYKKGKGLFL